MNCIEQKVWSDSHSSVWKEIVSRFGQSEYDDEARRTIHTAALKEEYDSLTYSRARQVEYAKLNQFEMQFDDQRDSTTTWVDAVNAIKAKYPKPS